MAIRQEEHLESLSQLYIYVWQSDPAISISVFSEKDQYLQKHFYETTNIFISDINV